jgi:dTDP-4-dehydrorhamnose reductase
MKTVCLLGRNGFIGSTALNIMEQRFPIVKEPYPCDVLVNCAGFSRMYEAAKCPAKMRAVENLVFDRICKVPFQRLIHVSSIYIETCPDHAYSIIKKEMEGRILERWPDAAILRVASVLGRGLQKNVIFDLVHGMPLWVTPDSIYNYISSDEVAGILSYLVNNPIEGIINVGASASILVSDVVKLVGVETAYGKQRDTILVDVSKLQEFYKVKTSAEYVEEYWRKMI